MSLSRDEVLGITRHLQDSLRRLDQAAFAVAVEMTPQSNDATDYLLGLFRTLIKFYSERSAGAYPDILDRMNHFVRTSEGEPVRGIAVRLSQQERELYHVDEVSFAELPDRTELITELRRLAGTIARETETEF